MDIDTKAKEGDNEEKSDEEITQTAMTIEEPRDDTINKSDEYDHNCGINDGMEDIPTGSVDLLEAQSYQSCTIKPIDKNVVHRICSGQVVVTLATAVKELLENSIDAGATSVDIRLIEYGSKSIEVVDNGCGVEEANFEGLGLKHHTSKIRDFEDITSIETFGFRGEALSSLCALSDLTVVTKYDPNHSKGASGAHGSYTGQGFRIEYDSKGRIKSKNTCARAVGTTVVVKNLFSTLPVRHGEFLKNLKREFHKMVNILNGYCLVTRGVRISCTNQLENGTVTKVLNVPASSSVKEKISLMFGSKQVDSLIEVTESCTCADDQVLSQYGLKEVPENPFKLTGFISVPHKGRSSNDRQFIFINSRPCDSSKITRIVNEVYHHYSRHQFPFLFLDIRTQSTEVDVNVTPDKRQIFLRNEKILYATVQSTLANVLETATCSYNTDRQQLPMFSNSFIKLNSESVQRGSDRQESLLKFGFHSQMSTRKTAQEFSASSGSLSFVTRDDGDASISLQSTEEDPEVMEIENLDAEVNLKKRKRAKLNIDSEKEPNFEAGERVRTSRKFNLIRYTPVECSPSNSRSKHSPVTTDELIGCKPQDDSSDSSDDIITLYDDEFANEAWVRTIELPALSESDKPCKFELHGASKMVTISLNWTELKQNAEHVGSVVGKNELSENIGRKFRARISKEDNEAAEDELKKLLSKDMFKEMHVIGQFNLGFVITKHGPDMFIIDQHATDEKFNFEDLEKNLVLQSHRLICPVNLQLPAVSETILSDSLDVFRKNGFDFSFNENVEASSRIQMTQIPYSKSVLFGKEDVEELIFLLEDAPERAFYRPSRIRDMLASRACRKSVMIGTHLNLKEMQRLVHHMGLMDQPWNCPHGRPTIRHLLNLNMVPSADFLKFNH